MGRAERSRAGIWLFYEECAPTPAALRGWRIVCAGSQRRISQGAFAPAHLSHAPSDPPEGTRVFQLSDRHAHGRDGEGHTQPSPPDGMDEARTGAAYALIDGRRC